MKGQYLSPSQLLKLQKETGLSYWDLIGRPLTKKEEGPKLYTLADIEDEVNQYALDHFSEGKDNVQAYTNDYDDVLGLDSLKDLKVINMYDSVIVNGLKQTPTPNNPIVGYDNGKDIPMFKGGKGGPLTFVNRMYRPLMTYLVSNGYSTAAVDNIMRQWAHESNYGTSNVALNNHNYGGYGYDGKGNYAKFKDDNLFIRTWVNNAVKHYPNLLKTSDTALYSKILKNHNYYGDTYENYTRNISNMNTLDQYLNKAKSQYLKDGAQIKLDQMDYIAPVDNTRVQKPFVNYNVPTVNDVLNTANNIPQSIQRPKYILPNIMDTYNNLQNDQLPLQVQLKWRNGKDTVNKLQLADNVKNSSTYKLYTKDKPLSPVDPIGETYIDLAGAKGLSAVGKIANANRFILNKKPISTLEQTARYIGNKLYTYRNFMDKYPLLDAITPF